MGLEVGAGAEPAAGAPQDGDPQRVVALELAERVGQGPRRRAVHRVARLGSIDDDRGDRVAALESNGHDYL
jgi:hypothetical protein